MRTDTGSAIDLAPAVEVAANIKRRQGYGVCRQGFSGSAFHPGCTRREHTRAEPRARLRPGLRCVVMYARTARGLVAIAATPGGSAPSAMVCCFSACVSTPDENLTDLADENLTVGSG